MTAATTSNELLHPVGRDGIVSIRMRDGDVRIRAVEGDTLRVRDGSARDLGGVFDIELGEGSASLLDRHGRRDGGAPDLDVEMPAGATLVIETVSAEIKANGLLGDQRYQTTSGDITLTGVRGGLVLEAVSGDLDIRATGDAQVTARTVSGDVELRAATLRSLDLTTTSGDVAVAGRLAGPGPFAIETVSGDARLAPAGDVRIEMATMSGDMHSELDGRIEGSRGHRTLSIGTTGPLVTFRSMSGDLDVVRPLPVATPAPAAPRAVSPVAAPAAPAPAQSAPAASASPSPGEAGTDPEPTAAPRNGAIAAAYEDARLGVLRALERGEIDVAEAGRRFEALDGGAAVGASDSIEDTTRVPVVEPDDA
ncbi:MAG: DUF4097 family beta strand repeat-containing protein [Chloroflexota bacterium]